jgi:hypothetical protein
MRTDADYETRKMTGAKKRVTQTTITQCDKQRRVTFNNDKKSYYSEPMSGVTAADVKATTSKNVKKGGYVIMSVTVTDTGERAKLFGFDAKHLKQVMSITPGPDACQKESIKIEMDGWYADLPNVAHTNNTVEYAAGAGAFAGATYDATSHYRAAAVFAFHRELGLTPERLRALNRHQVALLKQTFEEADLDPRVAAVEPIPDERRGGFLAIRTHLAAAVVPRLRTESVHVDARGDILRVGPAPYLRDDQLRDGMAAICRQLSVPSNR